ncbi:hypothetical protein Y023_5589 [Burkholderia pseudomallei A79D]|nr:hypothetical protein Y023_5589 [Burkholderia pseudomallei A79D]KGX95696.1 hypothetical protein X997_5374 [Burkholderia pseudomallei A79C]
MRVGQKKMLSCSDSSPRPSANSMANVPCGSITAQSPSRTNSNETAFPAQAKEPRKQSLTAAPTLNPTTINLPYPLHPTHSATLKPPKPENTS